MSSAGKLLLILGLIAIGGVIAIAGGAWYWWDRHGSEFLESGKATMEDGRRSGERLQESGCMKEAVARHTSDGGPGLASTVRNSVWLGGCLDASSPQADFCSGIPSPDNPVAVGTWTAGVCIQHGFSDPFCSSLFQNVPKYCASPERAEKMKAAPLPAATPPGLSPAPPSGPPPAPPG
jgi:hypothetical protein